MTARIKSMTYRNRTFIIGVALIIASGIAMYFIFDSFVMSTPEKARDKVISHLIEKNLINEYDRPMSWVAVRPMSIMGQLDLNVTKSWSASSVTGNGFVVSIIPYSLRGASYYVQIKMYDLDTFQLKIKKAYVVGYFGSVDEA